MSDYRQQEENEQERYERTYPVPFSDEWYARMQAAQAELRDVIESLNRRDWECLRQE